MGRTGPEKLQDKAGGGSELPAHDPDLARPRTRAMARASASGAFLLTAK